MDFRFFFSFPIQSRQWEWEMGRLGAYGCRVRVRVVPERGKVAREMRDKEREREEGCNCMEWSQWTF